MLKKALTVYSLDSFQILLLRGYVATKLVGFPIPMTVVTSLTATRFTPSDRDALRVPSSTITQNNATSQRMFRDARNK